MASRRARLMATDNGLVLEEFSLYEGDQPRKWNKVLLMTDLAVQLHEPNRRLDAIDRKILTVLQEDASLSVAEIGDRVGLSSTPCWKRIQRLEADGVILRRVALVDQNKIGLGISVFVSVESADHSEAWLRKFAERPVHRVGLLHGRMVPAIGDNDEPRSGHSRGNLLRQRGRGQFIAIADEHERRTFDRCQQRPRIRSRHDGLLLAQEHLCSGLLRHEAHARSQRLVALSAAM